MELSWRPNYCPAHAVVHLADLAYLTQQIKCYYVSSISTGDGMQIMQIMCYAAHCRKHASSINSSNDNIVQQPSHIKILDK